MAWKLMQPNPLQMIKMNKEIKDDVIARILVNRKVLPDKARLMLEEPELLLEQPSAIYNAEQAATEIADCLTDENATIYIFADYDVDGITSGFVMGRFLSSYNKAKITVYWPDRADNYGLSMSFCKEIVSRESKRTMVITVDNGVTKKEEVAFLKENGIEVVVTDHHLHQDGMVPDCTVCDPHMKEDSAGQHLCGCGVAWKVCQLIEEIMASKYNYDSNREYLSSLIYAVAIGTIADVMPMAPENIAIVQIGIKQINQRRGPKNFTYLKHMVGKDKWTSGDIAWEIAPKLNACGRIGNIQTAVDFMLGDTVDDAELNELYLNIEEMNEKRKKASKAAEKEADKMNYDDKRICLFNASEFPIGIMGVIANRISEKFQKPAFVYAIDNDGMATGSARSNGVGLKAMLQTELEAKHIVSFGGHDYACGFALEENMLATFEQGMETQMEELSETLSAVEVDMLLDTELKLTDVGHDLFNRINKLPYDKNSFPQPLFLFKEINVLDVKKSSKNPDNIQFTLSDGTQETKIWAWKMGNRYEALGNPSKIDLAATAEVDFTNKRRITLKIADLRASC